MIVSKTKRVTDYFFLRSYVNDVNQE